VILLVCEEKEHQNKRIM